MNGSSQRMKAYPKTLQYSVDFSQYSDSGDGFF